MSHCSVAAAMTTCSANIFPIQLNAWLSLPARDSLKKKRKKKSCLLLVSPLCPRTSLPVPCFMLHVHVVSSCFSDSPGSRLNLNFICKQFRPPTHDYICNNGGCVLHGWLLLCCRCCFACCTPQIAFFCEALTWPTNVIPVQLNTNKMQQNHGQNRFHSRFLCSGLPVFCCLGD